METPFFRGYRELIPSSDVIARDAAREEYAGSGKYSTRHLQHLFHALSDGQDFTPDRISAIAKRVGVRGTKVKEAHVPMLLFTLPEVGRLCQYLAGRGRIRGDYTDEEVKRVLSEV
jgi:hypothetical protein